MTVTILRRLIQAAATVFGVMLLTFVLFRLVAGDVSSQYLSAHATDADRQHWLAEHGYDRPLLVDWSRSPTSAAFWDSQFFGHLADSLTFRGRSFRTAETVGEILARRGPYSLAIALPTLAIGWSLALAIAMIAAARRGQWPDRLTTVGSSLGMCIPFLALMMAGQWLVFRLAPQAAWGLHTRGSLYVAAAVAVAASLGRNVRFYRTLIGQGLDADYVRTARACGASTGRVLLGHVMPNCLPAVLTDLAMAVPFLVMGSLLLESFFGIPGLGDLLVSSVAHRDVPVVAGLTFCLATLVVVGQLVADIACAALDPRIGLR